MDRWARIAEAFEGMAPSLRSSSSTPDLPTDAGAKCAPAIPARAATLPHLWLGGICLVCGTPQPFQGGAET